MKLPIVKNIGIVAPARKISPKEIEPAIDILKGWGINIFLGENLFSEANQFSGTDQQRAADFQSMIDDTKIDAIICARGGYGTSRIVDKLDFLPLKNHFKWIIGYSDITVLHNALAKIHLPSLHASMPINFPENDNDSLNYLKHFLLNGKFPHYHFESHVLNRQGKAEAPIVGGNLSVLYHLRGTPFDLDVTDKILFIEDLDEYLYHIDRMLINFRLAGWFSQIKGLIIGGMKGMHDNTIPFGKNTREIVADIVKDYHFPVAFIDGIGHSKRNLPLILGMPVKMRVDDNGSSLHFRH